MHDEHSPKVSVISPTTLVPIGLAVGIGLGMFGFSKWMYAQFDSLREEIRELKVSAHELGGNRWTAQDMEVFSLRLKLANSSLTVPDVSEIVARRQKQTGK